MTLQVQRWLYKVAAAAATSLIAGNAGAVVPTGTEAKAKVYYRAASAKLGFKTPETIFQSTLDDVAAYLGYDGLSGADMQDLPPAVLMNTEKLLGECDTPGNCLPEAHKRALLESLGPTLPRADDILVARFFAPKIMNIDEPEAVRKLGWRKVVRLRSRRGSAAEAHNIASGIVLFNFFTEPSTRPFTKAVESVNTQVMLITSADAILPPAKSEGPDTLYWLDYRPISKGGTLSLALEASFDAHELQKESGGTQPYFVPDGCVACHGANDRRPMVNYLDTDHWFDRLETDFPSLKEEGFPLLFDALNNDPTSPSFRLAFDVIRRFNQEADEQAARAQPKHDEVLTAKKWLSLHSNNNGHVAALDRAVGESTWSATRPKDRATLDALNRYCFRCHGSIKFSVFNRQSVLKKASMIHNMVAPTDAMKSVPDFKLMPPDRALDPDSLALIVDYVDGAGK